VYVTPRAIAEIDAPVVWDEAGIVDFCARATRAGFRHVLAADAYASCAGASERFARWQAAVDAYPDLQANWKEFSQRAPDVPPRRRVDLARLRASPRPRLLFVTHHWGGGVEAHVNGLARLLADDCEIVVLRPGIAGSLNVRWLRDGESLEAWFDAATEWEACRAVLASIGFARLHIHHVHGLPRQVLDLPAALGVPYDITLHDYFAICPQYHLADAQGAYCGEPDERGCDACIAGRPSQWSLGIRDWRALFQGVLLDAERVIVPSTDMATRMQRYYPDVQPQVLPHPELREGPPTLHKVVILGGLSAIKGMDLFEACARDAAERALPLRFHVIGHLSRPIEQSTLPVTVNGSYDDARLAELVALAHPDAFLFLSQVPESYSYTLTVAMTTGLPIVATQLGSFTERLRGYPSVALVAHDASAQSVNDALLRVLRAPVASIARPIPVSVHRA
jgi:glycosyltransferase involved in cell wall biosynthesis